MHAGQLARCVLVQFAARCNMQFADDLSIEEILERIVGADLGQDCFLIGALYCVFLPNFCPEKASYVCSQLENVIISSFLSF